MHNQNEEISKKRTAEIAGGFLYGGEIHSTIKIFEQVPGAKVTGKAAPGQQVHARITMRVATTQRQFEFHNQVQADAEGWFTHTIPYHTVADDDDAVQALSPCRFSVMRSEQEVHLGQLDITQEQVQRGKHMALQSSP